MVMVTVVYNFLRFSQPDEVRSRETLQGNYSALTVG